MTTKELILKALANEKRVEILNFIQQHHFVIKNDILKYFEQNRAALDHHLEILIEAELICVKEIKINNKAMSFVFPTAEIKVEVQELPEKHLMDTLSLEITKDNYKELIQQLWMSNPNVDQRILTSLLEKLTEKLDLPPLEFYCWNCRLKPGTTICSQCEKFFCRDCTEIITKTENNQRLILCRHCIEEHFS